MVVDWRALAVLPAQHPALVEAARAHQVVRVLPVGKLDVRAQLAVVIQETPLEAVQLQPTPAVTLTLPLPPLEVADALVAEME